MWDRTRNFDIVMKYGCYSKQFNMYVLDSQIVLYFTFTQIGENDTTNREMQVNNEKKFPRCKQV